MIFIFHAWHSRKKAYYVLLHYFYNYVAVQESKTDTSIREEDILGCISDIHKQKLNNGLREECYNTNKENIISVRSVSIILILATKTSVAIVFFPLAIYFWTSRWLSDKLFTHTYTHINTHTQTHTHLIYLYVYECGVHSQT